MANVSVQVRLTPGTTTPTTYTWDYSTDGGNTYQDVTGTSKFATVEARSSDTITLTLVANGQTGDACTFQGPSNGPLTFFKDYLMQDTFTPQWYTAPSGGSSSVTFTDSNPNRWNRTYYFKLNAIYTPSGQTGDAIQSPDPTIVNVGTDGSLKLEFGWKPAQESLREPAAAAV